MIPKHFFNLTKEFMKKTIGKLIAAKREANKLPFWIWLERREKIKRLARELDLIRQKVYVDGQGNWLVDYREFNDLYRIAKAQQELLNKKN